MREDYERVLGHAHAVRLVARGLDERGELDEAIDAIGHAEAVGPILDPTLYRDRHRAMAEDEATLRQVRILARLGVASEAGAAGERVGPAAS